MPRGFYLVGPDNPAAFLTPKYTAVSMHGGVSVLEDCVTVLKASGIQFASAGQSMLRDSLSLQAW